MTERSGLVARLPWVTWLRQTQDCDAYGLSRMPPGILGDLELMAPYRCKNRARWQFRASRRQTPVPAESGVYCWRHLWTCGLQHNPVEEARTARALKILQEDTR